MSLLWLLKEILPPEVEVESFGVISRIALVFLVMVYLYC